MGKYRSRSGCLTCRARRVKCKTLITAACSSTDIDSGDETRPICKACDKKSRPCEWESPHARFKDYQPEASSSKPVDGNEDKEEDLNESEEDIRRHSPRRKNSRAGAPSEPTSASVSSPSAQSPRFPFFAPASTSSTGGISAGSLARSNLSEGVSDGIGFPFKDAVPLTHDEALFVHHYTEHLGRWLDCTDATRQFTLGVPEKVKLCPVLCHAVVSFAARHRRDAATADAAYQQCIALLIDRLNEDTASHDETLLCAIVILRFYEQLNVPSSTGSDDEQHLSGCSAIIRTSQGHHFVDPSAPTLREAAFWVYVRQCLYNATINQHPPDIDFSLQLHPTPDSMQDAHPLARLRLETAWANQMTWNTACVVNFCFDGQMEQIHKNRRWQELWDLVQAWMKDRPNGFDPIYEGPAGNQSAFPEIWFTADWHIVSFGFYHFACILLLRYKPGPKFAIRTVSRLSETDREILVHARAICGASKSSPEIVPLTIIVCHTIFIWGPLVFDPKEQAELIHLLSDFENTHLWPATWIINALKAEWGVDISMDMDE